MRIFLQKVDNQWQVQIEDHYDRHLCLDEALAEVVRAMISGKSGYTRSREEWVAMEKNRNIGSVYQEEADLGPIIEFPKETHDV